MNKMSGNDNVSSRCRQRINIIGYLIDYRKAKKFVKGYLFLKIGIKYGSVNHFTSLIFEKYIVRFRYH